MTKGIYSFVDKKTGIVVYIGKDSNIHKRNRIKSHYYPSEYNRQQFNRVLQNNPDRYNANIICEYNNLTDDELNYLEIKEIMKHKYLYGERPKFNFTVGGDGASGHTHTAESKQKMSEAHKGKIRSEESIKKQINSISGEKHYGWKNYARIIKRGFSNNKQMYSIMYRGKDIKYSIHIYKLYKWFAENYPNEYLYLEVNQT